METKLIIFSMIMFTAGCIYTWIRWGVQKSISITFYEHNNTFLWWAWMVSFSVPILFAHPDPLIFMAVFGIILVGMAPDFKSTKMQETGHIAGAYGGIILAFVYLASKGQWIVVIAMIAFTIFAAFKLKNKTTWIEVAALYLTNVGLLMI